MANVASIIPPIAPPYRPLFRRHEEANRQAGNDDRSVEGESESIEQKLILIVEDNPDGRVVLEDLLLLLGYQVVTAANGVEALDVLKQGRIPSLILLDLSMPEMNGWEFRERQKQDPVWAEIPVIVMSAVATRSEVERSGLDAVAFLDKPVPPSVLLELIRRYT
jgi:CheY-like chemotaxis protein